MTALPPQHPETPPRYRFRPRSDKGWRAPAFRTPMTPRVVLPPTESFDPRNEPRPFEWSELRDPNIIVGGFAMFVALVAIVVIVFLSSVT